MTTTIETTDPVVRDACPELIIGLPGDDDTTPTTWDTTPAPAPATVTVTRDQPDDTTVDVTTGEILDKEEDLDSIAAQVATADLDQLRQLWTTHHKHQLWTDIEPLIADRKQQLEAAEG